LETSAKTRVNGDDAFMKLGERCAKKVRDEDGA
jgi:hypothetical protein